MKSQSHYPNSENEFGSIQNCSTENFSKKRILKNLFVICVGVLLLFIAYDGLSMLQSTMNREEGIGVTSQAITYAGFCVSSILFPKYVIKKLGSKVTLVLSMLTYLPYIASNFYPHWSLVIPASICIGLGASLLWGSQAIYLNDISVMYADIIYRNKRKNINIRNITNENYPNNFNLKKRQDRSLSCDYLSFNIRSEKENRIILPYFESPKRNSIGAIVRQSSPEASHSNLSTQQQLNETNLTGCHFQNKDYGNCKFIENYEIKSHSYENEKDINIKKKQQNSSNFCDRRKIVESTTARFFGIHGMAYLSCHLWSNLMTYYVLESEVTGDHVSNSSCVCGAKYCNIDSACFEQNITQPSDRIRYILTSACICIGVVSVFLIIFFLDSLETEKEKVSFSVKLLMATYKLARRKKLVLLIPFSFYIGMSQGFYTGDFTKSFIGCAWGTYHVGLVTVCYGTFCGMSAPLAGWLVKRVGRLPIFFMATIINIATCIFLLFWKPSAEEPVLFFVVAGLWGVFVGIIWSQLRAFYGILFKADEEAAFAAFHVWYSLGFVLSFAYSNHFCTSVKIYILMVMCTIGFIGYVMVEMLHWKNKNKSIVN
ncbi:protein unc-93 homolog A [Trichonephila clavata]|uniref:Protein unc-93 homolog A n=1 Tax=Trichonephila clavata TaxID=2740835 RepID=A0A8X6K8Q5_TRICU|nr:protein unc-93 homolog A [Trichonephila clavata]